MSTNVEESLMKKQVVLITGALTGIGRATALAFANEGARLVVSGRHDDEGQKLVAELRERGAEAEFLRSDVRHEDDLRSAAWSIRLSRALVVWMLLSIAQEPKAHPARSRNRLQKPTPRPSTQTSWVRCSA